EAHSIIYAKMDMFLFIDDFKVGQSIRSRLALSLAVTFNFASLGIKTVIFPQGQQHLEYLP
ncbi:MAG: hypothetical protein QXS27_08750, partial [Candidatus Jordarchaeaceae archaeon]